MTKHDYFWLGYLAGLTTAWLFLCAWSDYKRGDRFIMLPKWKRLFYWIRRWR